MKKMKKVKTMMKVWMKMMEAVVCWSIEIIEYGQQARLKNADDGDEMIDDDAGIENFCEPAGREVD